MKQVIAYTSDYSEALLKKRSEALAHDAKHYARQISTQITGSPEGRTNIEKSLMIFADKGISPRKLMRMYSKLWRVRQAFMEATQAEDMQKQAEENLPF